jgi:4-hydroxy-tetrahydrodipicolinate synthase
MAIEGTFAAVITPRTADGAIDEAGLRRWLEFLMEKGIKGFAINGATGEFCQTSEAEFDRLISVVAETVKGRALILAGVGAASSNGAIRLAKLAAKAEAEALLLPMPYFFPYSQGDLKMFCQTVAKAVATPVLLYNLPQFTSGLDAKTSLELIRDCGGIVGIKDSSGSLETLRLLTTEGVESVRLIGNDGVIARALAEGVADGVVSGVACVLPELITRLWERGRVSVEGREFDELGSALLLFIEQLDGFPVPWGLKIVGAARSLAQTQFPFPFSHERKQQADEFERWFWEHEDRLQVIQPTEGRVR